MSKTQKQSIPRQNMFILITKGITLYIISWIIWRLLRHFVVKTDLDNVPGPDSHSFLKGMSCGILTLDFLTVYQGNFGKMFNVNAWKYHEDLAHQCKLVKIHRRTILTIVFD